MNTKENIKSDTSKFDIQNLNAGFDSQHVLHDITLSIPKNKVTAIIGPSGCGKSTFIRCLNRMHELIPSAYINGCVKLDAHNIYAKHIDPVLLRRQVGMVFQKPNPFPTLSIKNNILSGLRLTHTLNKENSDHILQESLIQVGLWDEVKNRLNSLASKLSGGQQQRLCIARSIAVKPKVLLMDEPCSALDPIATARIEKLIHSLKEYYTIIIITHNMQQAKRISDKTVFFLNGHIIEYDETNKLFTSPSNSRTKDYITGKFG